MHRQAFPRKVRALEKKRRLFVFWNGKERGKKISQKNPQIDACARGDEVSNGFFEDRNDYVL